MSVSAISAAPAYQQSYPGMYQLPGVSRPTTPDTASAPEPLAVTIPAPAEATEAKVWRSAKGELRSDPGAPPTAAEASDSFGFSDLIDIINPLQHIPGVSLAYRALTGDTIKPAENVAGGFLYGGAFGGLIAMATSTMGELFEAGRDSAAAPVAVAQRTGKFGGIAAPGALSLTA